MHAVKITDGTIREGLELIAVHVACNNDGDEFYNVGERDVTAIVWGETNGHMAPLKTIVVYKDSKLHSEHPFSCVLGVYYKQPSEIKP